MVWLKALHVTFVVTWFAGLFYLPRLFVYHASARDQISHERFIVMERRLFAMMTVGASAAAFFGIMMVARAPMLLDSRWLQLKLLLVTALIGYHWWCHRLMTAFRHNANRHSEKWFRGFNEVPSLLLVSIVVLAVVKPF